MPCSRQPASSFVDEQLLPGLLHVSSTICKPFPETHPSHCSPITSSLRPTHPTHMQEFNLYDEARCHTINMRQPFQLGPFECTPMRVTHSIPDCCGLVLRSEHGTIVHTGDWKIDENPVDGEVFDREMFDNLGEPPRHVSGRRMSVAGRGVAACAWAWLLCPSSPAGPPTPGAAPAPTHPPKHIHTPIHPHNLTRPLQAARA